MLENARINAILPAADLSRARKFYEGKLGLKPMAEDPSPGVVYQGGGDTMLYIYQTPNAGNATHTQVGFDVDDVEAAVKELRAKGVVFEEYDMPEAGVKTVNGVATMDGMRSAWFKDTEGNILTLGNYKETFGEKSGMASMKAGM